MRKILALGLVMVCGVVFGQNYSGYSQLRPLEGSVSDDMQQANANAFRRREEKREIERIKYERKQLEINNKDRQKEYEIEDRKAIYKASINSNIGNKILLYGGENYDIFLGCFNCDKYDTDSVWNNYGKYGSKLSSGSIWNFVGTYGGKYGKYSPFSIAAPNPPKIVDEKGVFMGYFTINKYYTDRRESVLLNAICEKWEAISENINEMTK